MEHNVLIIGGGPAGASCGLWLTLLGLDCLILDRQKHLGGVQAGSKYPNPWVTGMGIVDGRTISANIENHLLAAKVPFRTSVSVRRAVEGAKGFEVEAEAGGSLQHFSAGRIVAATGLTPIRGGMKPGEGILFGPGQAIHDIAPHGKRIAILGGGDNGLEHMGHFLNTTASEVRLFARSIRGRKDLLDKIPPDRIHHGPYTISQADMSVDGRKFDIILVFYGFVARTPYLDPLSPERDPRGFLAADPETRESSTAGLYAIGDLANRLYPSTLTSMADGVIAAQAILADGK